MTDTTYLDTSEKVDILLKQAFGFPSTSEKKQWYEETAVSYNNYLTGEDLFIDNIPFNPDFDNSGIVRNANEIKLQSSNFVSYSHDTNIKSLCSIVDDSTGTIRRFKNVILEQSPALGSDVGASWLLFDSSNNNILSDAFQFNYKQYKIGSILYQPYLYTLYSEASISTSEPDIPFGQKGGNWFFDTKSGLIFFSDFVNFSNGIQNESRYQISNTNKPVLTFYKYIGKKGISYINESINNIQQQINNIDLSSLNIDLSSLNIDISLDIINDVKNDLSNLILNFYDLSTNFYDLSNNLNDLTTNFYDLSSNFNDLSTNFNDLSSNFYDLSSNFNDLTNNFYDLSSNFYDLSSNFNDLSSNFYDKVDIIENSYNFLENKLLNIDSSINKLNSIDISLQNYDISLTQLIQDVRDICGSEFLEKIRNISGDIINLESSVISISGDLVNIINTINNLDISYVTDLCFNEYILSQNTLINNIENNLLSNDERISELVLNLNELSNNVFNALNDISNIDICSNNLDPYFTNQLNLLTSENILLKTDINYNRSLIQTNSINYDILENRIQLIDENIKYFNDYLQDICGSKIDNNLINLVYDISNSLNQLNENFASQNILLKSDSLIANSNINYNTTKIYLLEDDLNKLNSKFANLLKNVSDLDLSNILNVNSDVLLNLYDENKFLKSDILLANNNNNYCQEKIDIIDNLIENINSSINKLYIKTNNYNINNLYLFFNNVIFNEDKIYELKIDYIATYKNGFYNNLLFNNNLLCFENLENLLINNNSIFIELYGTCFCDNNNSLNNISLNMSCDNTEITCLSNVIIGNNIINPSTNNNYLTFGPISYKLTKNINDNKCIYYKNKFNFYLSSELSNIKISDIKIIIKILNYNL